MPECGGGIISGTYQADDYEGDIFYLVQWTFEVYTQKE